MRTTTRLLALTLLLLAVAVALPAAAAAGGSAASGLGGGPAARAVAAPPALSSLSPKSGRVGRSVTIVGAHFGASQGDGYVVFGVVAARITSWSAKRIGTRVPAGLTPGRYPVRVCDLNSKSNAVAFTVTSPTGGDARLLGKWSVRAAGRSETFTFKSAGTFSYVITAGSRTSTTTGSFWASKGSLLLFKRRVDGKPAVNVTVKYSLQGGARTLVVGTESFRKS
jgi:hypothetical protein